MNVLNILKNLSKKQLITIGISIILLISLPLVIFLAQKQQTIKQRAAENSNTLTYLTISTENIGSQSIGSQFESTVHLINNDPSRQITALDITIKDNEDNMNLLGVTSIPGSGFSEALNSKTSGIIHYVAVNLGNLNSISNQANDIPLLKFTFTPKNAVNGTIGISNAKITTLGNNQTISIPDVANKSGTYSPTSSFQASAGNSDSTIAAIDIILANLDAAMDTESEVYSGLGVLNYGNIAQIIITGGKLTGLDDQISLYTAIKKDLSSGKSMEQVLNTYRSYLDSSGQINTAGQQFFQQTYGDLTRPGAILAQYDKECADYIAQQIKENPENKNNPEVWKCDTQSMYKKSEILDFRVKAEKIVQNSNSPLTIALEQYDKADRNGENLDNQIAEIYFQMAKLLQAKANDKLAINFYDLASKYTASPRASEAKEEMVNLNKLGHKALLMGSTVLIGMVGLDNLIPLGPVVKGARIAYQGLKIVSKFTVRESFNPVLMKAAFSIGKEYVESGGTQVTKKLISNLVKAGIPDGTAGKIAEVTEKIANGITPDENELRVAREAIQEASEKAVQAGKNIPKDVTRAAAELSQELIDQNKLKDEIEVIARIKGAANYKKKFLSDLEKKGGQTIAAAQSLLSERVLGYVDDFAGRGFLSKENAETFLQTANQMTKDLAEEYVDRSGVLFWKSIDTSKLMKIDELMHKAIASVSYLEHVASSQSFSDHSFRHLDEDLSKATIAIEGISSFTKSDRVYLKFISLLHDIGYAATDVVKNPLNYKRTDIHPASSLAFVHDELAKDITELIGGKSVQILNNNGIKSDLAETIGNEGANIIEHAIGAHSDKGFKYTSDILSGNYRVAALFALSDDLAANKVPDLFKFPEIADIATEFWKAANADIDIANAIGAYGGKLDDFQLGKYGNKTADEFYAELKHMDSGVGTLLGDFRQKYRNQMLDALTKYKSTISLIRYNQFVKAIETTTESAFSFAIRPAVIEETSFRIVNREAGKIGAHVTIKISKSAYKDLALKVGTVEVNKQLTTKILKDLVIRGSDAVTDVTKKVDDIFMKRGGDFGTGNTVTIVFPFTDAELGSLPKIVK